MLKPGENSCSISWDRISENEFAAVVAETLAALFPQDPPEFLIRIPYGYFDVKAFTMSFRGQGLRQTKRFRLPALPGHRRRMMLPSPIATEHR